MERDLRRRGERVFLMRERIYVNVPLALKNRFAELARQNGMTQSEFGLAVLEEVVREPCWAAVAVELYRERRENG